MRIYYPSRNPPFIADKPLERDELREEGILWSITGKGRLWIQSTYRDGKRIDSVTLSQQFCFPYCDRLVRGLLHKRCLQEGHPSEVAECCLDIAIPRLWGISLSGQDVSSATELALAIVLRDNAWRDYWQAVIAEREAIQHWSANRGKTRIIEEREHVPYSPSIGSRRELYRLIGYDRTESNCVSY